MIAAILITALVMGYPLHRRTVERNEARAALKAAEARACGLGIRLLLTTVERDHARRQVRPSTRPAPVADVIPIRKGDAGCRPKSCGERPR